MTNDTHIIGFDKVALSDNQKELLAQQHALDVETQQLASAFQALLDVQHHFPNEEAMDTVLGMLTKEAVDRQRQAVTLKQTLNLDIF